MSRCRFTSEAENDLNEIWYYIARNNIAAADRWVAKLCAATEALARNTNMGHIRSDLTDRTIRFWPVGAYLILYRDLPNQIEIVAVTRGGRDIPSLLRERS